MSEPFIQPDQSDQKPHPVLGVRPTGQLGLLVLLSFAAVYCLVLLWRNPRYISDPQPTTPSRAAELADKIDPNTADASSLSALPQVGEKRARDLIAFRERAKTRQTDGIVFHRSIDLLRVPGIGASLANQMEPYLIFPSTVSAPLPDMK